MKTKDYLLDTDNITVPQLYNLEDSEYVANAKVNLQFYNTSGDLAFDYGQYLNTDDGDQYNCQNWIAVIEQLYKDFEVVEDGSILVDAGCVVDGNDSSIGGVGTKNTTTQYVTGSKTVTKNIYVNYNGATQLSDGTGSGSGSWHVGITRKPQEDTYIVELQQFVSTTTDYESNIVGSYCSLSVRLVHNKVNNTYTINTSHALDGTGDYSYAHYLQILYK